MAQASRHGTLLAELQEKVGKAIAQLTNNEAAYVSCGAASGITLAVAACDSQEDAQPGPDLPHRRVCDAHARLAHPLTHRPHAATAPYSSSRMRVR